VSVLLQESGGVAASKGSKHMQGIVRWYSAKGFGFIDSSDSTDGKAIYFHLSDVKNRTVFKTGDAVTFETASTLKGPKAVNVQATDTKEALKCPQKI
jgi:cold shock CspA family protein